MSDPHWKWMQWGETRKPASGPLAATVAALIIAAALRRFNHVPATVP
jgi:hypothetical protein